jgi:transposase
MPTKATTTTTCVDGSVNGASATASPARAIESSTRLGRHRWVVERTVSWLAGCRRLHRRYERKAEHFLAFVGIAAALIGYRRLAR